MESYYACVDNQVDVIQNYYDFPEQTYNLSNFDTISDAQFEQTNLTKCNFRDILVNDAPQAIAWNWHYHHKKIFSRSIKGTALTFVAIANAVVDFPASWFFALLWFG